MFHIEPSTSGHHQLPVDMASLITRVNDRWPPPSAGDITGGAEGVVEPVDGDLHHLPQSLVLCTRHWLQEKTKVRGQHR